MISCEIYFNVFWDLKHIQFVKGRFISFQKLYQINVCAVTEYGRSDPCHCVINHGAKGSDLQISGLCMEHVTTTSARVAWKPVNSNFVHSISIGELEDEGKRR